MTIKQFFCRHKFDKIEHADHVRVGSGWSVCYDVFYCKKCESLRIKPAQPWKRTTHGIKITNFTYIKP